jgi:hypothetical protein
MRVSNTILNIYTVLSLFAIAVHGFQVVSFHDKVVEVARGTEATDGGNPDS